MELVLDGALDIACGIHASEEFTLHIENLRAADSACFCCKFWSDGCACVICINFGVGKIDCAGGVPVFGVLARFAENLCFVHGIAEFKA